MKNQWGWGGFTTHDLARCRLAARLLALFYDWWNIFVRLAEPGLHREAITSQGNRVKLFYRVIRLARKSSSHPAVFRLSRREAFPGANRIRFCAMCLIVQKLAGA